MSFWERFRNGLHECRRTPAVALLALLLLAPLYAGKIPCKFTTNSRVVAVADIHGDFDNFKKILKGTGLIDDDLNWIGGDAHFVQLGDVLDRGDHGRKILDLLMRLEKQAEEEGGMVHVLIGNHEEANITGLVFDQAGYLTYGQLISFLPQDFVERYNKTFRKKLGLTDGSDGKSDPRIADLWTKEVAKAQGKPPGENETRDAYCKNFYMNYGKWLLTKNIVIKINENIFVHGGLSDNNTYLNKDLETLNNEARREFRAVAEWAARERVDLALPSQNYLMRPESPQWYRDWARDPEDGNSVTLDKILSNYRAKRMIIGHTVRDVEFIETRKLDRFDGKIWAIDVGISEFYNDIQCALEIRRERIPIILREYDVSRFEIYWGDDEKK